MNANATLHPQGITVYKLTDQAMQTHGGYQWVLGQEHQASGDGLLCSSTWLHAYTHPHLAVLLNPIHAAFPKPRLFKARAHGQMLDDGLKIGVTKLMLIRELPLPVFSPHELAVWAVHLAQAVRGLRSPIPVWDEWARRFIDAAAAARAARATAAAVHAADAAADAAAVHAAAAAAAAARAADADAVSAVTIQVANLITFDLPTIHRTFLAWRRRQS